MHERLLLRHRFAKLARLSALVGHFCAGDTRWDLQQSLPHQVGPKASVYTSLDVRYSYDYMPQYQSSWGLPPDSLGPCCCCCGRKRAGRDLKLIWN